MEIYKRFRRNNTLLISKKTVIFIINSEKQIFTEFTETTSVSSLKKYIQHYLNNKYIDILFDNQVIHNNLNLNDLCRGNPNIRRLFFQVINQKDAKVIKEEVKRINKYKKEINEIKNNNFNLNSELIKLKKENTQKNLENQDIAEKCKNINEIYEKQEGEINELKNELIKINDNINQINNNFKNNKTYLIESRNKFEIVSNNKFKKSKSIIYLASTYTIAGRNNNSTNIFNTQSHLTTNQSKMAKSNSVDYSTVNSNNNITLTNSEIVTESNNYTTSSTKKENNLKNNIIDKDKEIIKKGYNPKYLDINFKHIGEDLSIEKNDTVNNIKKWFTMFKYLDLNEQLLFSLIDKKNGLFILYYWIYFLNNKIKSIEKRIEIISKEYSAINKSYFFVISRFAKTAFKMLNNVIYSKAFEKPVNYFKDEKKYLISSYKILFQLTKIFENEDILNMEEDLFLDKMIENMKTRNGKGGSLGNYIQNLISNQLDFGFDNLIKIHEIMKKYNIDKINNNEITKLDKTSGVISVIVKDILIYMGLYLEEKCRDEKIIQKNDIFIEYKNNTKLKEEYLDNIQKIKNIISYKYI